MTKNGWTFKGRCMCLFGPSMRLSGLGWSTNSVTIPCRLLRRTGETAGCVLAPYACTLQGELQPANQGCQATPKLLFDRDRPTQSSSSKHLFTPPVSIHYMYITVHHAMPSFAQPASTCTWTTWTTSSGTRTGKTGGVQLSFRLRPGTASLRQEDVEPSVPSCILLSSSVSSEPNPHHARTRHPPAMAFSSLLQPHFSRASLTPAECYSIQWFMSVGRPEMTMRATRRRRIVACNLELPRQDRTPASMSGWRMSS